MANTNVTMRIDETLKSQLQELMSSLGLDMTTFFTMAAKQAVREQALPFKPDMNTGIYGLQAYKLAMQNTNYNQKGKAVISSDDEWKAETEWDDMFEQMKKERGIESKSINRPVIVLDENILGVLSVKITKHKARKEDPYDIPIIYWEEASLRLASTARVSKVTLLTKDSFIFKIGNLHPDDLSRIEDMYRKFLKDNGAI